MVSADSLVVSDAWIERSVHALSHSTPRFCIDSMEGEVPCCAPQAVSGRAANTKRAAAPRKIPHRGSRAARSKHRGIGSILPSSRRRFLRTRPSLLPAMCTRRPTPAETTRNTSRGKGGAPVPHRVPTGEGLEPIRSPQHPTDRDPGRHAFVRPGPKAGYRRSVLPAKAPFKLLGGSRPESTMERMDVSNGVRSPDE